MDRVCGGSEHERGAIITISFGDMRKLKDWSDVRWIKETV